MREFPGIVDAHDRRAVESIGRAVLGGQVPVGIVGRLVIQTNDVAEFMRDAGRSTSRVAIVVRTTSLGICGTVDIDVGGPAAHAGRDQDVRRGGDRLVGLDRRDVEIEHREVRGDVQPSVVNVLRFLGVEGCGVAITIVSSIGRGGPNASVKIDERRTGGTAVGVQDGHPVRQELNA